MSNNVIDICRYELVVVASDGGDPPKSGSTIVNITVVDVNDNAPVFDNETYEVCTLGYNWAISQKRWEQLSALATIIII